MDSKKYVYFLLGVIITLLLFFSVTKWSIFEKKEVINDYYILKNQITHMNKMVVIEQDFSSIEKTSVSYEVFGKTISNNKIVTHTKTNAQVSYNLNNMEIKVDSINKKLIISQLPKAEVNIRPSVEITSMDDSFINRIDEKQIKKVTLSAKNNAIKKVNKKVLITKANKQLFKNLEQIFVLARALNYKIENQTSTTLPH